MEKDKEASLSFPVPGLCVDAVGGACSLRSSARNPVSATKDESWIQDVQDERRAGAFYRWALLEGATSVSRCKSAHRIMQGQGQGQDSQHL